MNGALPLLVTKPGPGLRPLGMELGLSNQGLLAKAALAWAEILGGG